MLRIDFVIGVLLQSCCCPLLLHFESISPFLRFDLTGISINNQGGSCSQDKKEEFLIVLWFLQGQSLHALY